MFDDDPGQVASGQSHEVIAYLAAWKPTYIYVSPQRRFYLP